MHLIAADAADDERKPEKVKIEAVDQAAAVLGNTRAVAKSSYVHPHILDTYGSKDFSKYYKKARLKNQKKGLDARESELLWFLEDLFEREFTLLRQT